MNLLPIHDRHDKAQMKPYPRIVAAMATAFASLVAQAGVVGQSLTAEVTGGSVTVVTSFSNPSTVGAGIEFTTQFADDIQTWTMELDFSDLGLEVDFSSSSGNDGGVGLGQPLTIQVRGFSGLTGATRTGYTCPVTTSACGTPPGPFDVMAFSDDTMTLTFRALRHHENYSYSVVTAAVPEPATLAMVALALIAVPGLRLGRIGATARR